MIIYACMPEDMGLCLLGGRGGKMMPSNVRLRMLRYATLFIVSMLAATGANSSMERRQSQSKKPVDLRQVDQIANYFIHRFHETLDFGIAFDEVAVPDAVQRLQRARFFQTLDLSDSLAEEMDSVTAGRLYKVFMSFYYLRGIYAISIKVGLTDIERAPLPAEIREAIQNSHLRFTLTDSVEDPPKITTAQELKQYIADLEHIARLYKKHLPRNVFNSPTYKANVETFNRDRGKPVQIFNGYEQLGINKDEKVYVVRRDIFTLYIIRRGSQFRVLTLGVGE